MRFRRCDRYLLREVAGPFVVAAAALFLFIVLSLVLSLSDLMVDRGAGIGTLLRLLVLKSPVMLVLALPVSGLFAMFLGLGRMAHDREILAFEAAGVSLRRLMMPLILFAVVVSLGDFALYNWGVPSSELKYQEVLQGVIYRSGIPSIRSNTFFSGPNGEVYFVRQYDESDQSLRDVVIYDVQGRLIPQAEANLLMVTAERGTWSESSWRLDEGRAYGYDESGVLLYAGSFEALDVPLDLEPSGIYATSRPATAMSMSELNAQIGLQRSRGMNPSALEIEYHRKMAVPLAAIVFVLLGGALSLIYGWKSRGTGIAISFIVVGAYQGFYVWMGSLGGGGVVAPWIAAWLPNIVFGSIALLVFARLDTLGSRDRLRRLRRWVPFLLLMAGVFAVAIPLVAQETVDVKADTVSVSADGDRFVAAGSVEIMLGRISLQADRIVGESAVDVGWLLQAEGNVKLTDEGGFGLASERAAIGVREGDGGWQPVTGSMDTFELRGTFVNSEDEEHVLWVRGATGELQFSEEGEVERIDVSEAQFSTCERCETCQVGRDYSFESQPYALSAQRVTFYPDRLVLAARVTGCLFGVPVVWIPAYVQPLAETLASPLFPSIGRDAERGWYLKWNVPFFFSDEAYGVVLFDLFGGVKKVGVGGEFRYTAKQHDFRWAGYAYPASETDSIYEFEFRDSVELDDDWDLEAMVEYGREGESQELDYASSVSGPVAGGMLELTASRERVLDDDGAELRMTDRLPELTFSGGGWAIGQIHLVPTLAAGYLRETLPAGDGSEEQWETEAVRARAAAVATMEALSMLGFEVRPRLNWAADQYWLESMVQRQQTLYLDLQGESPLGVSWDYDLLCVWGESPLASDAETRRHELSVGVFREVARQLSLRLAGGVDLAGLEPLPIEMDLNWRGEDEEGRSATVNVEAAYSLVGARLDRIETATDWVAANGWRLSTSSGVELTKGEWLPLTWVFRAENDAGWWRVSSSGAYDANTLSMSRADCVVDIVPPGTWSPFPAREGGDAEGQGPDMDVDRLNWSIEFDEGIWEFGGKVEWLVGTDWGVSLGGRWTSSAGGTLDPEIGVFRQFSDCLRLGIESTRSATWLYISVQAFPEAVLRYAPGQGDVEFGS